MNNESIKKVYDLKEVLFSDIMKYKTERRSGDYSLGGFYLILDTKNNKGYIGKSVNVLKRLKSHYYKSNNNKGLIIDLSMHDRVTEFRFFIIYTYLNLGINFFTRKLEQVYEHTLIGKYKTYHPYGYNMRYYDRLRIK